MGIFNHHHATSSGLGTASQGYHMSDQENDHEKTSTEHSSTSSAAQTDTKGKSACGCGCAHNTKPVDEEVVEIKEEWDY